jgi:hypothetical protein
MHSYYMRNSINFFQFLEYESMYCMLKKLFILK